ncbi:hypothetical protein CYMTET_36308, partial [Cymbomonas tetramitiformis]
VLIACFACYLTKEDLKANRAAAKMAKFLSGGTGMINIKTLDEGRLDRVCAGFVFMVGCEDAEVVGMGLDNLSLFTGKVAFKDLSEKCQRLLLMGLTGAVTCPTEFGNKVPQYYQTVVNMIEGIVIANVPEDVRDKAALALSWTVEHCGTGDYASDSLWTQAVQ